MNTADEVSPRATVLYVCYEAATEPLVWTQVIGYLKYLVLAGYEIHLITYEKRRLTRSDRNRITHELRSVGITWHALRYHRRPTLPATVFDIACGVVRGFLICRRHQISFLHCRSHVAALIGLLLKVFANRPFIFDCRGLLADEYVDSGHWRAEGFLFRLTKAAERLILRHADAVVVLTERLRSELAGPGPESVRPIVAIPCCVDMPIPTPRVTREAVRAVRSWTDKFVCAYVGKLGGWYPVDLIGSFFEALRRQEPSAFLFVATQSDPEILGRALDKVGVPRDKWSAEELLPGDIIPVLAATDAGLSLIQPSPSKRASSPTKVGEYLAAGVPVVSTAGIGDCDTLLLDNRVGVIIGGSTNGDYDAAAQTLIAVACHQQTRDRCVRVAQDHLSIESVGAVRYEHLYRTVAARARLPRPSERMGAG